MPFLNQQQLICRKDICLIDDNFISTCVDNNIEGMELLLWNICDKFNISVKQTSRYKVSNQNQYVFANWFQV